MRRGLHLLVLGLLSTALVLGLLLALVPGGSGELRGSVYARGTNGRSIALELLRDLGFDASAWTRAPGHLAPAPALLIMKEAPRTPPGYGESGARGRGGPGVVGERGRATAQERRLRDPLHYLRWVEGGGVLLLPATEENLGFLTDVLGLGEVSQIERVLFPNEGVLSLWDRFLTSPPRERGGADWGHGARLAAAVSAALEVAFEDGAGRVRALRYSQGEGALLLLAPGDDWLSNGSVVEEGNALLLVRLVEAQAPAGRVLFDEYALGGWMPDTPLELAFAPTSLPFSLHVVCLALLGLWSTAWVRSFPRDPVAHRPVSALVRAQGFAGILVRARRWDLLSILLRRGILSRLAPGAGWRADPRHEPLDPRRVREALAPLTHGASQRNEAEELFLSRPVGGREELERLAADLLAFEAELHRDVVATPRRR